MRLTTLLYVLLLSAPATAQAFPPVFCDQAPLTVDWPTGAPVQLASSELKFRSYGDFSQLFFTLKNRGAKPVIQVAALIEIEGNENEHLLTFAARSIAPGFYGKTPNVPPYFEADNGGGLETVLYPGETTNVVPRSIWVLPSCPARARLTFLQVDAIQQEQFRYSAEDVRTDPVFKSHGTADLLPLPVTESYEKLLTLRIDDQGKPSLTGVVGYPDELPSWLNRLLGSWKFLPTEFNGIALQERTNFLFRFHPTRQPEWERLLKYSKEQKPFVVVEIYPSEQHDKVHVDIGHFTSAN